MSFGQGGKKNFCVNSSSDRIGMASNKILKLMMWFSWNETVNEMNGRWQYLRRSCLIIMVLSEVSNFGLGNQTDNQNQILERSVQKIVLLVEKQVLVNSPTKEPDSRWFYHFGGASCRCQKSKKGTDMECMKYMMENLFWNYLWDNYLVLTLSFVFEKSKLN